MAYQKLASNLPDKLRSVGLKVVETPGWVNRGRPASTGGFAPHGVLCHHTATSVKSSDKAVVDLLIKGRSDLPGPLAQFGLARDGTVYVIAAGRANHAGRAKKSGYIGSGDGNEMYIGIEAFNDGVGEKWSDKQYDAYARLAAALLEFVVGGTADGVRGHKETSTTGKIDPTFSMGKFRTAVYHQRQDIQSKPKKEKPPVKKSPPKKVYPARVEKALAAIRFAYQNTPKRNKNRRRYLRDAYRLIKKW